MDIQQLQKQAETYLQQEDFTIAINLYEQCLELAPEATNLYWYLGLSWLLQGDEEKSYQIWLSSFTDADLLNPDSPVIEFINFLKNQGDKYFQNNKFSLAQKIYLAILEWDDQQLEVYNKLGHSIANQGDLETAISCWENITAIQPDYLPAYLNQAKLWQKLGEFNAAIENYKLAIDLQPDYNYYYQLGLCYSHIQEWEKAKDCFLQVIEIKNDHAAAYSDLGFVILQQGDVLTAIEYLQQAIKIQPHFCNALINLPETVITNSKQTVINSIELFKKLNSEKNNLAEIYLLIHKLIAKNYPEISLKLLQKILENQNDNLSNLSACLEISNLLLLQNQPQAAINAINQQLETPEIYLTLGKCWLKLENYQQATINLEKAIKINPQLTEAYYFLGITLFKQNNLSAAIETLKKQLEIEPLSPLTLAYLGFIYGNNHQPETAETYFKKAIKNNSAIIPIVNELNNQLLQSQKITPLQNILENTPRSFYETTTQWLDQNNLFSADNYIQIYPETDIKLTYPKSINQEIHYSFRFGDIVKLPASYVVKIPQARYWLSTDQTESVIMTDQWHFLGDLSPYYPILSPQHPAKHPSQHPILSTPKLPSIHFIEGKVAVLTGLTNHVYFHWMLDVLPRWELLRISNHDFADIDYFIVDNQLPFQKETLAKLQIPEHKQINIREFPHLQATELIVPSFPGCVAWMSNWTCDFLKQQFLDHTISENSQIQQPKKRIYITRKLAKSRRIINEPEITNFLKLYGFETVILEAMTVAEQALLFSQAEIIISPHGSGLTNIAFCQPQTKVIELFSPNYVYHCYWWLSNLVGLDYYYLIGESLPGENLHHLIYPQEFAEDIFINIDDLENILKLANLNLI
ncbi:MAG: DUF563 domain-containing protein [Nostocales cyanobacterium]|nr:MAG: DUF563 domain-containing protein [Nostocales cyanobacterium]